MTKRLHSPTMSPTNVPPSSTVETTSEREPKRRRSAPPPLELNGAVDMRPEKIVDVIEDGDVLLVVSKLNGEEKK